MSESPARQRKEAQFDYLQSLNCTEQHSTVSKCAVTWIDDAQTRNTEVLPASSSQIIIVWGIKERLATKHLTNNWTK